jgi:hypothetical protein
MKQTGIRIPEALTPAPAPHPAEAPAIEDHLEQHGAAHSALLRRLYEQVQASSHDISEAIGVAHDVIRDVAFQLSNDGLVIFSAAGEGERGFRMTMTWQGILEAEALGLVEPEAAQRREEAALAMLRYVGGLFKKHRWNKVAVEREIIAAGGGDMHATRAFVVFLSEGFLEPARLSGCFYISDHGQRRLFEIEKEERTARQFRDRLAQIEGIPPQARGTALELLLRDVIRAQGYACEHNVRSPGEQNDLVVQFGPFPIVGEVKWEAPPIEAGVIREMIGRMVERPPQFTGVILSMSGFTEGASETALHLANQRAVLLIGEVDVRALICGRRLFRDIVDERLLRLAMRRPSE